MRRVDKHNGTSRQFRIEKLRLQTTHCTRPGLGEPTDKKMLTTARKKVVFLFDLLNQNIFVSVENLWFPRAEGDGAESPAEVLKVNSNLINLRFYTSKEFGKNCTPSGKGIATFKLSHTFCAVCMSKFCCKYSVRYSYTERGVNFD